MNKINVSDASGNILHETYAKRAKGLVKKGRAYYVDAHTICLKTQAMEEPMETLTLQDILSRLDTITNDTKHIQEAMMLMERMPNNIEEDAVKARSEAISDIVKEREETNRKIIGLLEMMYQTIQPTEEIK